MEPPGWRDAPARSVRLAVLGLSALALVFGFVELTGKSMWLDESASVDYADRGLRSLFDVLSGGDPNMGLYYVLLHGWMRIFGEGEVAVRSMSVLFAVATVPVMYLVGLRLFDRTAGLLAALFLTLDSFFVQYSQEARAYSLVLLFLTLSMLFFVEELERPSTWVRVGYVLSTGLALYAQYFSVFVIAAQIAAFALWRVRFRRWLVSWACVGLVWLPEAIAAGRRGTGALSWVTEPSLHDLVHTAKALAGGSWTVLAVALLAGLYGARWGLRRVGVAAAWFFVPLLGSFVASFVVHPMFVRQYLSVGLPGLILLAAAGIALLPRPAAGAVVLAVAALSSLHIADWYAAPSKEDWRAATAYVLAEERPSDGVVFYPHWSALPVHYYEHLRGVAGPVNLTRKWQLAPLGGRARVAVMVRKGDALAPPSGLERIERVLEQKYSRVADRNFAGVRVELFRRR